MDKAKKMVQFKDGVDSKSEPREPDVVEINEGKIDRLLHLLHEADPTNPDTDTEEMLKLERTLFFWLFNFVLLNKFYFIM